MKLIRVCQTLALVLATVSANAKSVEMFSGINQVNFVDEQYNKAFAGNGFLIEHQNKIYAVTLIDDDTVNWPLERIALESGFSNRVTFVKAFKDVMSCTPSAYKKQNRLKKSELGFLFLFKHCRLAGPVKRL